MNVRILFTIFSIIFSLFSLKAVNYYTYQSGNWNTPNVWTTDPSGTTLVSPAVPGNGDAVTILNGITVTLTGNVATTTHVLTINSGGILDLATFTFTAGLTSINGLGTLRIGASYFPTGTNNFTTSVGSSVEYYDWASNTTLPTNVTTYYNLTLSHSLASTRTFTFGSAATTINGNFVLDCAGTGLVFQLGDVIGTVRTLVFNGDVTIGTNCTMNVLAGTTVTHSITCAGNFTNNGTLDLQNNADYTAGANTASITFNGAADKILSINAAATSFGSFTLNKGIDQTFILSVVCTVAGTAPFDGNLGNNMITLTNGTLRLGENITVPQLNTGGNYDISTGQNNNAGLWIDGAIVSQGGGSAMVVYGKFRVSGGSYTINSGQACIVTRDQGELLFEGGTTTMVTLRPSVNALSTGSYTQTGGTVTITGAVTNTSNPVFCWPFTTASFNMSGGTINISLPTASGTAINGGILIASSAFSVTGGTWNINIPASARNFNINSSVPFWDINVRKAGAGAGVMTIGNQQMNHTSLGSPVTFTAKPLVVLNDLTLINGASSPTFDASINNATDQNVTVGGHFNIQTGCTYTPGVNTTTFNGIGAQTFTNSGTITTGLYDFTVNKTAGTLTLAGTVATTTVRHDLTISAGTLADGGKTIDVKGNVVNSGTHSGAGNITLSSTTAAQTITSTSGVFGNLVLNNTFNTAGAAMITLVGSTSVTGNLTLNQNNLFDISSYNLALGATSTIVGAVGATRFIKTTGLATDAGITKSYSAASLAFTFPVGTTATPNYTPATITLAGTNPTVFGSITVRPINSEHPLTTNSGLAIPYYWKVSSTGFTLAGGTTVTHTYTYLDPTHIVATEGHYVPGRYTSSNSLWATGPSADVNQAGNIITFAAASFGAVIDGDYTTGDNNPSASGPFNPIRVFYSRNGGAFDWNNTAGTSWSLVSHVGAATALVPTVNDVVQIGDATNNTHNMVIDANTALCGQLKIAAGCTLTVSTFTGHNFGTYSTPPSGNGTIRIASNTTLSGNFNDFIGTSGGTFEYFGSSYTLPTTFATYYNLVLTPDAGQILTMPDASLTIYNDMTTQQASATGTSHFNNSVTSRTITINGGIKVLSGNLQFVNASAQSVVVAGNVSVSAGATFDVENSAALTHSLTISGGISNAGTLDFSTAGSNCNVTFSGAVDKTISGAGATTDFNVLTVNKGTSQTQILEVTSTAFTLSGPTPNLVLTNGTFKFSSPSSLTLNLSTTAFTIPVTTCLSMNSSGSIINMATANAAANDLFLNGKLQVLVGTVNVGTTGNTFGNDIEYSAAGFPEIDMQGAGVLNVNGQIRRTLTSTTGSLLFGMSGTSTILIRGVAPSTLRGMLEVTNTGSVFNMSGTPTIILQNAAGVDYGDLYIVPTSSTVTGGTIQFGNASTVAAEIFKLLSSVSLYNITVNTTNAPTVRLDNYALTLKNNLNIQALATFNANGLNVNIGGNLTNSNIIATTGTAVGGFRAGSATQTTTFNSTTANQTITGTATPNRTNFANLEINNTFGTVTLAANTAVTVNSALTLTSGTLADGGNIIRVLGNVSNSATHSGAGKIYLNGTTQHTISGSGAGVFQNLELDNATGSIFTAAQTVNGNLTLTTGIFEINSYLLTLNTNANVVVAAPSATKMIKMSGSLVAAGITKSFPTGAFNITFAVGSGTKYTPVTYNVTTNTAPGSINITVVDNKHPSTQDPLALELSYYWSVTAVGFAGLNVTHTYNYIQSDVFGNEALYKTGRFYNGDWLPVDGYAGTVSAAANTMTLTNMNFIDGDYTAGESDGSTTIEFQALKTYYSRNSTLGGNWDNVNSWSTDDILQHAGAPATKMPEGNPVVIATGHTILANGDSRVARSTILNGTAIIDFDNYVNQTPGIVSGTGTIRVRTTGGGSLLIPTGNYTAFSSAAGGTFEFYGTTNATLNAAAFTFNNVIFSGASTKTLASGSYVLNGNLTITSGTVSNTTNNSSLSIRGNWTNNSSATAFVPGAGVGTVTFNGTSAQSIGGTFATNFNNLIVNNSSATGVTLNQPAFVAKALTLTDGFVYTTPTNLLTVRHTATSTSGSATSYVAGPMKKVGTSSFVFPIGTTDGSKWARIGMTTVSGYDATTEFTASYTFTGAANNTPAEMAGGLDHVSYAEVWDLTRTLDPSNNASAQVSLYYEDAAIITGSGIVSPADTRVAHFSGGFWQNMGGSGASPITSTVAFTSFSPITFGSIVSYGSNPLPVELISFTAVPLNNKEVVLDWKTATEINNNYFLIEKSSNAVDYEVVTSVASKAINGNSSTILNYDAIDSSPYSGTSYYRLKQIDFNGDYKYSDVVAVNLNENAELVFDVYPNPTDGNSFNISFATEYDKDYFIEVYDLQGKQLLLQKVIADKAGVSTFEIIPANQFSSGMYFVKLNSNGKSNYKKIIVK
ncbi:MAG: T9SS type A sorting domain-containing protein [Bacteroidetes bacterium]|nr:T9SS type A sorting domain-containing protein [Bacteroidota bacterium]